MAPGPSMPLAELARILPGWLERRGYFRIDPHGLSVRRARGRGARRRDTGDVAIERYVIAYDIGKAVNPKLVEGQIAGGLAQGVGGALFEEFLYDENWRAALGHVRRLSDADRARNP